MIRKINIGCGWEIREGWENFDNTSKPQRKNYPIEFLDVTKPWSIFENNSIDYILSEHMIEHIDPKCVLFVFEECFRVLKPSGVIRFSCPDRAFFELPLFDHLHPFTKNYCEKIFNKVNYTPNLNDVRKIIKRTLMEQGHVWVPTKEQLIQKIKNAGFKKAYQVEFGKSDFEVFNGLEKPNGLREWESICVEAIKLV